VGDSQALRLTRQFTDFPAAIAAVVRVAELAEERDHHPDIDIRWRTVTFTVRTHSAGGVTVLDIALAAAISDLFA
jgi:4a-hydroxytetrahydrobiopterin dehydratase